MVSQFKVGDSVRHRMSIFGIGIVTGIHPIAGVQVKWKNDTAFYYNEKPEEFGHNDIKKLVPLTKLEQALK